MEKKLTKEKEKYQRNIKLKKKSVKKLLVYEDFILHSLIREIFLKIFRIPEKVYLPKIDYLIKSNKIMTILQQRTSQKIKQNHLLFFGAHLSKCGLFLEIRE